MAGGATVDPDAVRCSRPGKPLSSMAMIPHLSTPALRRVVLAGFALPLMLAGCTPIIANRGNMLDEDRIAQVKTGSSSKNDVFEALGSPSVVSTFDDNTWYYVGQRTEREAFFKPVVTDRKLIAVQFDDTDHVKSMDRVGLDQAVDIEPLEQTTPAVGREITFMEQLIGNVGRPSSKKKKKGGDDEGS
jgi:outer membrane protein assembly factor BamE (lipoprotein component of BamABCDE complex)